MDQGMGRWDGKGHGMLTKGESGRLPPRGGDANSHGMDMLTAPPVDWTGTRQREREPACDSLSVRCYSVILPPPINASS